jgi:hypothetical protein
MECNRPRYPALGALADFRCDGSFPSLSKLSSKG